MGGRYSDTEGMPQFLNFLGKGKAGRPSGTTGNNVSSHVPFINGLEQLINFILKGAFHKVDNQEKKWKSQDPVANETA